MITFGMALKIQIELSKKNAANTFYTGALYTNIREESESLGVLS